ncbi:MAG: DNA polymerase III subunit gamma/tau [Coraliomargaritaceae bacterium]
MPFSQDLPDHLRSVRAVEVLERALASGRLAHGILLHGNEIADLEAIAKALANNLLQTHRDPLDHPDCFTLRPSGKARLIRIGESGEQNTMRALVANLQKSANQGGNKVGIVYEADRMNQQSANAFLKTLEEPSQGTTLLLLTTRPYDLLDTIRSRCLNFSVPGRASGVIHADWEPWAADYHQWISSILSARNSQAIAHVILGAYGLNARLQKILETITAEAWETEKDRLPEHASNEEKEASQASLSKHQRSRLLAEIGQLTNIFARELERINPGRLPVSALHRSRMALEHCAGLLALNFNQSAAIEGFLLQSMRIWRSTRG